MSDKKKPLYYTWEEGDFKAQANAINAAHASMNENTATVQRAKAYNSFKNWLPSVSVREGFDRRDYDFFRPGEQIPTDPKDKIAACMLAYSRVGPVRNVIDMMTDFACKGIDLVHRQPSAQKFYKTWFKKVNGPERTERMINMLLKAGIVVTRRTTAYLPPSVEDQMLKTVADADMNAENPPKPKRREIPWSYTILNPLTLEVVGGDLAPFVGVDSYQYAVKLPMPLMKKIKNPKPGGEQDLVNMLPLNILKAAKDGKQLVPLDPEKTSVLFYKKDDHQVWAEPMLFCILKDLFQLEKMKLADLAALDGAISHVRIWKLGSIQGRIYPTGEAMNRLADMLIANVGGGSIDLIWGPDIELDETSTDVHKFLGEEKYKPVLAAIFQGLGVPPSLTGLPSPGGFTNNFISLRTLTERLEYVRKVIIKFWENEIRLVQQAMGFRFPAQIVFDQQSLSDDEAQKRLLIELLDRDVVSEEAVQERFDFIPEIEWMRKRRERRMRKNGKLGRKAGPWNNPEQLEALEKIFAQLGVLTPSEVGLDLDEKKRGQKTPLEMQADLAPQPTVDPQKGEPGMGRPAGKKDKEKRKKKKQKPRTSAALVAQAMTWAEQAQKFIADNIHPAFLKSVGKKTLRELTTEEGDNLEKLKFAVLCNCPFGKELSRANIKELLGKKLGIPKPIADLIKTVIARYVEQNGTVPPIEQSRKISAAVYALYHSDETGNTDNGL